MSKFNDYKKAHEEVKKPKAPVTTVNNPPKRARETKEQMSIMLTPSQKKRLREMANELNMSASELIGHWIEQN